jgi:hypothetical protein
MSDDYIEHLRDRAPVELEINPWAFALMLSGWMWAAVWFLAWVMA